MRLDIIFQNEDFLVVNKPAGLPTMPGRLFPSLVDIVLQKFPEQSGVGKNNECGIVHRLDNCVSGIVLIAKNDETYMTLRNVFSNHEVEKEYTTLVHGFLKESGQIELAIKSGVGSDSRSVISADGKKAKTMFTCDDHYLFLENEEMHPCSFVRAYSKSGARHQIRVHFSHIGYPIVGDEIYSKKYPKLMKRIFFHASSIGFEINGKRFCIKSPLPKSLKETINNLIIRK